MVESFADAKRVWRNPDYNDKDIDKYIEWFKELKAKNQLSGSEKDISYWIPKGFWSFYQFVDKKRDKEVERKTKIVKTKDADKIFENEEFYVYHIRSHEASRKYGAGTKWCITESTPAHWNSYVNKGIKFYFIIDKHYDAAHKYSKIAVAVYPEILGGAVEVFNQFDDPMNFDVFESWCDHYNIPLKIFNFPKIDLIVNVLNHMRNKLPSGWSSERWAETRCQAALDLSFRHVDRDWHYYKEVEQLPEMKEIKVASYNEDRRNKYVKLSFNIYEDNSVWEQRVFTGATYNYVYENPQEFFIRFEDVWTSYKEMRNNPHRDEKAFESITSSGIWKTLKYLVDNVFGEFE